MTQTIIVSFGVFLAAFVAIGVLATMKAKKTSEDYLVASRSVSPWMIALSAVATQNSGFMFIGLIGYAYTSGIQAAWLMGGWVLGDFFSWLWVQRRVRQESGKHKANSFPTLLGTNGDGSVQRSVVQVAALFTLLFLAGYAAAQLNAGGKALHVLFGWDLWIGALVGTLIVTLYCFAGGIRASIWTDAAQSVVMLLAIGIMLGYCIAEFGGLGSLANQLNSIDNTLLQWIPDEVSTAGLGPILGFAIYFLASACGGAGIIGQPHIMIRVMALDSVTNIGKTRAIYLTFMASFAALCVICGLYARIAVPAITDSEMALPLMAHTMMPQVLTGLMLAGIFSATMSTADSQLLSCSAAVTQDLFPSISQRTPIVKGVTLFVALIAFTISQTAGQSVFDLVLDAWAVLGAAFGPVLLMRLAGRQAPAWATIGAMCTAAVIALTWKYTPYSWVYKILPATLASSALLLITSKKRK